jgi:ABC-type dipeptide/oligopeptide/nickel transport system permease component
MNFRATLWKTIRILGISLALVVLLVFSTGVVSDWNHHSASDDANCPYCHLGHQTPAQFIAAPSVILLKPVASLLLPQDAAPPTDHVFLQTAPRAPPAA